MNVSETDLPGVLLVEPDVYGDRRGFFMETWNAERYREFGLDLRFVQDNLSQSQPRVLRGLHFQNPHPQGKLITVLSGEIYDVVVDLRAQSKTFGRWLGTTLSAANHRQLYVPEGFAHGFVVTGREAALFHYKCTEVYHPEAEGVVRWDDPTLGITWPVAEPIVSEKDREAPLLEEVPRNRFEFKHHTTPAKDA